MRLAAIALALGLCASASTAVGQARADLDLRATQTGNVITQTRTQSLSLVVSNLGPDSVPAVSARTSLEGIPPFVITTASPGCTMQTSPSSFQPGWSIYTWHVGPLDAGNRRTCSLTFRATPSATDTLFSGSFGLISNPAIMDPNPFNDAVSVPLFSVSATDFITDVALSVSYSPTVLPPGTRGTVTVTVRNLGPDMATNVGAITSEYEFGFGNTEKFRLFGLASTSCALFFNDVGGSTGGVGGRRLQFVFDPIPAGTERSCTVGIEAAQFAAGTRNLEFTAGNNGFGVFDPNLDNNALSVHFLFSALAVPGLTRAGILALCIAILMLVAVRQRRWRRHGTLLK